MEQKLNYIELINQFWTCHKENCFSTSEIALYFHLLNTANSLGWKNPFREANMVICAVLNISEPTLQRCRDRLVRAGLIEFKSGKVKRELTEYMILILGTRLGINSLYLSDTQSDTLSSTQSDTLSDTQSSEIAFDFLKLNKTKQEEEKKENLPKEKKEPPPEELIFDEGRKLFPGTKRGLETEYENFKKKHKDWKNAVYLIKPAIENEIEHKRRLKAKSQFVPEWKNFQTWINQRCWEQEFFENKKEKTNGSANRLYELQGQLPDWFDRIQ
jgi:hypothetical protein